jgi:hypothetical protein
MVRGIAICAHFEPCQPSVAKRQDAALAIPADVVAWEHAYKFFSLPRHLDKEEETFHIKEAANKLPCPHLNAVLAFLKAFVRHLFRSGF